MAPYFPPRRRVGSLRPFRFACHLERFGWRPIVVCLATPGEALSEQEARCSAAVLRLEITTPIDFTRRQAGGEYGQGAALEPRQPSRALRCAARAAAGLRDGLDTSLPLDTWAPLLAWHGLRLLPQLARLAPEVVFSTADPWSSHLLGAWLGRRLGVPWVADFRDPWTLCPFRGRGPAITQRINRALERQVFARSSHATFTTERTLARYQAAYPEAAARMSCLPNGFDATLLQDPVDAVLAPLPASAPLRLCFFGRFRPLSPARAMLLALGHLLEREPRARGKVLASGVGALPPEDAALAAALGVSDAYEPLPAVRYEDTLGALRRHDISLLSTAPERDDVVPAKLWDYLAARRPILSLGRNPDVGRLLATLSAGVQLDPLDTGQVAELLGRCLASKAEGEQLPIPTRARSEPIAEFEAERLTQRLATLFESLTDAQTV